MMLNYNIVFVWRKIGADPLIIRMFTCFWAFLLVLINIFYILCLSGSERGNRAAGADEG